MNPGAVVELPLDESLLKVLSSESRREILRLLAERRMTGAELAQRLELGKPAVAEHLQKLTQSNLIVRVDDAERRWVYYELTPQGRDILEPKRVRFYLVLGVGVLALLAGIALALGYVSLMGGTLGAMSLSDDGDAGGKISGLDVGGALNNVTQGVVPNMSPLPIPGSALGSGSGIIPLAAQVPIYNRTVVLPAGETDESPTVLRVVVVPPSLPTPTSPSLSAPTPATGTIVGTVEGVVADSSDLLNQSVVYVFSLADVDLLNGTVKVHATNATLPEASLGDVVALAVDGIGLVPVETAVSNTTLPLDASASAAPASTAAPAVAPSSPTPIAPSQTQPAAAPAVAPTTQAAPTPSDATTPSATTTSTAPPASPAVVNTASPPAATTPAATPPAASPASSSTPSDGARNDALLATPAPPNAPASPPAASTPKPAGFNLDNALPLGLLVVGALAAVLVRLRMK